MFPDNLTMKLEPNQVIDGRYTIIEHLGQGGMGAVWKATDANTHDSLVVLKMPLRFRDPEILKRFEREAAAMRKYAGDCVNILDIQDIGNIPLDKVDSVPFYVTRFQTGGTLEDWTCPVDKNGTPEWTPESFDWLTGIATALDFLHQQEKPVFHRDVKPANILFNASGTPLLSDFGIVKDIQRATSSFSGTANWGTLAYMPPEVLNGQPFTATSDQYSLAAAVYEKIAGRRPFIGETPMAMAQSLLKGLQPLVEVVPEIGPDASAALDRALSQEAEDRFPSCRSFARTFLKGLPVVDTEVPIKPPVAVPPAIDKEPVVEQSLEEESTRELDLAKYRQEVRKPKEISGEPNRFHVRSNAGKGGLDIAGSIDVASNGISQPLPSGKQSKTWLWITGGAIALLCGAISVGLVLSDADTQGTSGLNSQSVPPPVSLEPEITNSLGMKFRLIPVGEFEMGSPKDEVGRNDQDQELHSEGIEQAYYLSATEVTQAQWGLVMQTEPWKEEGWGVQKSGLSPATFVSLSDAKEFCRKLSDITGEAHRLPSEPEWEYACRSGTKSSYSFDGGVEQLPDHAWYDANTELNEEAYAHDVGQKKPNGFGLFDMHGNVWEWFAGETAEESGVRGGGWIFTENECRSASRMLVPLDTRNYNIGFRVVRTITNEEN